MSETKEETVIKNWFQKSNELFTSLEIGKSCFSIDTTRNIWKDQDIPNVVKHPSVDFLQSPAFVLDKKFTELKLAQKSGGSPIPENYQIFNSIPGKPIENNLVEQLEMSNPIYSIIPPEKVGQLSDPRRKVPIIDVPEVEYFTFEEGAIKAATDLISPIILSMFVFDVSTGKRVSEQWSFVPEQCRSQLTEYEGFKDFLQAPLSASFVIKRPKLSKSTKLTEGLFLVLTFDRPVIPKGAAINTYYDSPKEANKKKAISSLKNMNTDGYVMTFAYSSIHVPDLLKTVKEGEEKMFLFDKVTATEDMDEAFLQHKLSKVRKHPHYYSSMVVSMNIKSGLHGKKMEHFYHFNPVFSLKYENYLELKIKSTQLSLKSYGLKNKNLACKISLVDNGRPLPVFHGKSEVTTRCQFNHNQPIFVEDYAIDLPAFVTASMNIVIKIINLGSKKKGENTNCGEAILPLLSNGLLIPNGERKIQIVNDPKSDTKNYITLEIIFHTSINTSYQTASELLKCNYAEYPVKFSEIISFLPPILDLIIANICQAEVAAFAKLMQIIDLFPVDPSDVRYVTFKPFYEGKIIQPIDHLLFYVKYCALKNTDSALFYATFLHQWYLRSKEPTSFERPDLRSCPFMFEIVLKCILIDKKRLYMPELSDIISNLQKTIFDFRKIHEEGGNLGLRLNHYLCLFYKDLIEFADRGIVLQFVRSHLAYIDIRLNKFDQEIFVDFLSSFMSVKAFICSCIPMMGENPESSLFTRNIIPIIEEGLATSEHTQKVFSILYKLLSYLDISELQAIAPNLEKIVILIGRNRSIILSYESSLSLLFPLIVAIYLTNYYNFDKIDFYYGECCRLLLETSDKEICTATGTYAIIQEKCNFGKMNSSSFKAVTPEEKATSCIDLKETWKKFAFVAQLVCLCVSLSTDSVFAMSQILTTFYSIKVSSALFHFVKDSTVNYIRNNPCLVFDSPYSRVYKMISFIIKNMSPYNVEILEALWEVEESAFHTNNRCRALCLRGFMKHGINNEKLAHLEKSKLLLALATEFCKLTNYIESLDQSDDGNYELISDGMVKLADFYRPSPDCRVKTLLDLAHFHVDHAFKFESVIAQLTAITIIAEYLCILKRLPRVFTDELHQCRAFECAYASATNEACPDSILSDLPKIPGFCSTKYFSECGIIYLFHMSMEICKRAQLLELMTKMLSLLRPLLERRHLWKVLGNNYQNGAISFALIAQLGEQNEKELGTYYRIEFQGGGTYIYHEVQLANLWQVSEKIKNKAKSLAGEKPVVVLNDGEDLSQAKIEDGKYYVHVKSVEQYFTPEEKHSRTTVFDQSSNLLRFYFDLPYSKDAQRSIEHLYLKRTIYTVPYPMPHIVTRVQVPPENVKKEIFSPIEYSCQSLQAQVEKINEATSKGDFKSLQPLIQGSLLTQVNEGPKKMAEVFLNGSNENNHTMELRRLFRKFLKANSKAVKLHGEWVTKNPAFVNLQEELELGLKRISSNLQPFLK